MELTSSDSIFYLLIAFFSIYIILQIYIVFKLRTIIQKLFDILFRIDNLIQKFRKSKPDTTGSTIQCCKNCKKRIPFYYNESNVDGFFYYRCQLTKKQVQATYVCKKFVFDPQTYDV